ncbi:MAG: class I SAM-dependent methyltransferase, partial [Acidobacteria bacterium]|nr:class I SAM-dependent methyltransferase [Acidobacteriota bacterium]
MPFGFLRKNPAPRPASAAAGRYEGYLDGVEAGFVKGWALDRQNPSAPASVEIFHGKDLIATVPAGQHRLDLLRARVGDGSGNFGFAAELPPRLRDLRSFTLRAVAGGETELSNSPLQVNEDPNHPFRRPGQHVRIFLGEQYLTGSGLEIGALSHPLRLPAGVTVRYVDVKSVEQLRAAYGPDLQGIDIVPVDIVTDAHTLSAVPDASQDFVIANQVLEHLENPLLALENFLRVLKPGGIAFLSLPDQRFTFDSARPITPFAHLLDDYRLGPGQSRETHYREWAALVENTPAA